MDTKVIDLSALRRQGSLFDKSPAPVPFGTVPAASAARQVATTPQVDAMLAADAAVAMSVSGGKDGAAMALAVVKHLDRIGHSGPRLLIHADLGRVEWTDSLPSCERLARLLGLELVVVRRQAGDMLARWQGRWIANVTRYEALSCVRLILPWSTPALRYCTSELKTAVITRELRKRFPTQPIVNVVGIRRQESPGRRKMPVSGDMPALARRGGFTGVAWNAVIEWPLEDVWAEIHDAGLLPHEAYTRYGSSRVSCAFCIMGSMADLQASTRCEDNQAVYRQMVELEAESTFAFQGARWLADVAPQLLSAELVERVQHAKAMALVRCAAEARLPEHLLFVKGWPTRMPTTGEAALIAAVRRDVSAAVGLSSACLDADAVMARYGELMAARRGAVDATADAPADCEPDLVTDMGC